MMLAEQGKLSVSDPITRHLPDYPSYGDSITIEHLLTHTSGIVSYTGIPGYMASEVKKDITVQELIDVFKDLPVEFAPGERYAYNNSGYILLGAIVEAASGMPYTRTTCARTSSNRWAWSDPTMAVHPASSRAGRPATKVVTKGSPTSDT